MSITILDTDDFRVIAKKVWDRLAVGSSLDIHGWAMNEISQQLSPLGLLVVEQMKYLDEVDNIKYRGERRVRQYKFMEDSVGGPLAQKIFRWQKVVLNNNPRIRIWRIQ